MTSRKNKSLKCIGCALVGKTLKQCHLCNSAMCSADCGLHTNDMPSAVAPHTDSMPTSPLGIDDVASSSGVTAHNFIYTCGLQEINAKKKSRK